MGVDYYPCKGGCDGTYADCDDYVTCVVCYASACEDCGKSYWAKKKCTDKKCDHNVEFEEKDGTFYVCDECDTVNVDDKEVIAYLMSLYCTMPGADKTLSVADIVAELSEGRVSKYTQYKRERDQRAEGDGDDDGSGGGVEKEAETETDAKRPASPLHDDAATAAVAGAAKRARTGDEPVAQP